MFIKHLHFLFCEISVHVFYPLLFFSQSLSTVRPCDSACRLFDGSLGASEQSLRPAAWPASDLALVCISPLSIGAFPESLLSYSPLPSALTDFLHFLAHILLFATF